MTKRTIKYFFQVLLFFSVYHSHAQPIDRKQLVERHTIINTGFPTAINTNTYEPFKISIERNKIHVENFKEKKNFIFSLTDLSGRIIYKKEILNPSTSFEIQIPKSVS